MVSFEPKRPLRYPELMTVEMRRRDCETRCVERTAVSACSKLSQG